MRCFVAIEINDNCRKALSEAVGKLRTRVGNAKWVMPENMHLTLKFIGNLSRQMLPELCGGLERACEQTPPFTMCVRGLGAFPPTGHPKIIFACIDEETQNLQNLAELVESELARNAGIKKENRKFTPHITLCRVRSRSGCPAPEKLAEKLDSRDFGAVDVRDVVLMESKLTPDGPEYTVMEKFNLG